MEKSASLPKLPDIPACAWKRPLGEGWSHPYTVRYASNLDDGPYHGMPLGGLGAGCIGRSHRGDFNLWHIDGGEHVFRSVPGCQFAVFEQVEGNAPQAYALCTQPAEDGTLSSWQWYPEQAKGEDGSTSGTYSALYPRSWFSYQRVFQADLVCEQFSPIWAGNYRETSYPIAVFQWTAHNSGDRPITLSLMLAWQNMVGWFTNTLKAPEVKVRDDGSPVYEYQPRWGQSQGNYNQWVADHDRVGCLMDSANRGEVPQEGDGQWAIAAAINPYRDEVFYHTRWNPQGDGSELWQPFSTGGSLPDCADDTPAQEGEQVGAAIALRFTLQPGETRHIPFALVWDVPITEFAEGITYYRRYTDFFGRNGFNAWPMARTALRHYRQWQEHIQNWQNSIVQHETLPDWFKMALFNELYDLTDGATLWSAADDRDPIGQFAVVECLDYRWYESLDVRLYGSFALLMLFPELDKAVLRAFARAIPMEDDRPRIIGYYVTQGQNSPLAVRKVANATPHDLGAPNEHPWEKTNYTSYQDCNLWKDLGSDFVLQVYRDFVLTGRKDVDFLLECWPAVVATLHYLKTFDQDGDGIPENSGAPDQTFDDWRLQGISAYCGGLWIAALEAAIAIGESLLAVAENGTDPKAAIATFQDWVTQARSHYEAALWNGQYYRLDSGSHSDVVMADQLCGQFYACLLHLPPVVPQDRALTALQTIYEACFLRFNQSIHSQRSSSHPCSSTPPGSTPSLPYIGAANGVRLDGSPVNPNDTHPLEVWTGINFGLAAFMLHMGMEDEAFQITEAVVRQIYDNGLQFRTPEAITAAGTFRASHYLRAMAIWVIYGIVTQFSDSSEWLGD